MINIFKLKKKEINEEVKQEEKNTKRKKIIIFSSLLSLVIVTTISCIVIHKVINKEEYTNVNVKINEDGCYVYQGVRYYEHEGIMSIGSFTDEVKEKIVMPDKINNKFVYSWITPFNEEISKKVKEIVLPQKLYQVSNNTLYSMGLYFTNLKYNEYKNGYYLGSSTNPYMYLIKYNRKNNERIIVHDDVIGYGICLGNFINGNHRDELNESDVVKYKHGYYLRSNKNKHHTFVGLVRSEPLFPSLKIHRKTKVIDDNVYPASANQYKRIKLPNNLEVLRSMSCALGVTSLNNMPKKVTYLNDYLFKLYDNKKVLRIPEGVVKVGFLSPNLGGEPRKIKKIILPSTIEYFSPGTLYWYPNLKKIKVHRKNQSYKTINRNLYSYDNKTLIKYLGSNKTFKVPNKVTKIGRSAFSNCEDLLEVYIPNSVTEIESSAFDTSCENLVIYCETNSKPVGWEEGWSSNLPVVWGKK